VDFRISVGVVTNEGSDQKRKWIPEPDMVICYDVAGSNAVRSISCPDGSCRVEAITFAPLLGCIEVLRPSIESAWYACIHRIRVPVAAHDCTTRD